MASRSGVRAPERYHGMIRNAQSGLRRWREVKRRPVQGNSPNDRILRGPDCHRHKRVYADSFPATPLPQVPGIQEASRNAFREACGIYRSDGIKLFPNRSAVPPPVGRPRGWGGPYREITMRFCRRLLSFAERFKNARALVMRFFRHGGIYRSDVSSHLINLMPGSRFTVGSGPGYRTRRKNTPCPSSAMSSGRLFLDRVARQHCPSSLHRHTQINMHSAEAQGKGDISILPGRGHFYFALTRRKSESLPSTIRTAS